MQREIDSIGTTRPVRLLGVNGAYDEAGNALITPGRTLPWLQDRPDVNAWVAWAVEYRDVVILDTQNRKLRAYNLTQHSLLDPANYAELKALLIGYAGAPPAARRSVSSTTTTR